MKQSTNQIMMMEPIAFHSNPETSATNSYQHDDPRDVEAIQRQAVQEFRGFRDRLVEKGIIVVSTLGQEGSPDDIFCNNWVATFGDGTLAYYPMLAPNRQIERRRDIMNMLEARYDIALDFSPYEAEGKFLESTGAHWLDRVNKVAYFSLSARCDEALAHKWCEQMGFEAVTFRTRNHAGIPVYHTDVMMFIGTGYAGICSSCIVEEDRARVLEKLSRYHEIIDISMEQLRAFCGNSLELRGTDDKKFLVMSGSAYRAYGEGQKHHFLKFVDEIVFSDIPTIEKYGGGSARCMLLELH